MQPASQQSHLITINLLTTGGGGEQWLARSGGGLCPAGIELPPSSGSGNEGGACEPPAAFCVPHGGVGVAWRVPSEESLHPRVHEAVHPLGIAGGFCGCKPVGYTEALMAFLTPLCHQNKGEDTPPSGCLAVHHLPGEEARDPQLRGNGDAPERCKVSSTAGQQSPPLARGWHPGGLEGCMEMNIT